MNLKRIETDPGCTFPGTDGQEHSVCRTRRVSVFYDDSSGISVDHRLPGNRDLPANHHESTLTEKRYVTASQKAGQQGVS